MTILTGAKPATKTLGLDANGVLVVTEGYDPQQTVFSYSQRDVPNIRALARVLEEVSLTPEAFAIRGALREHVDPEQRVFRRVDVNRWGLDAHFEECPRQWGMIDIDKVLLDNIDLVNDPAGTVKRAIQRYLPECYHNVSFVWQLSSSAGVGDATGLLSIHIWFLFDRAVGFNELKTFHELQAPAVDTAVFRTVQVHFVAAPKFEEGIQDHLPRRIGLVEQDNNVVALPELPPEVVATGYRSIGKGPTGTVRGFESKLKTMGDGKGLDGFHGPLRDAAASHVSGKFEWEIDTEWLKARLRRAIDKAPKNAGRGQGIRRYKSDAYLDDIISSAMAKFCQIITHPTYPAPSCTAEAARGEIERHLHAAADSHFEALVVWERSNKIYRHVLKHFFDTLMAKAIRRAKRTGEGADEQNLWREAEKECDARGIAGPGPMPKAVLNLAVGVGLGKTEQAFKLIGYVGDKARSLLAADANAAEGDKLTNETRVAYKRLTRAVLAVPTHKLADEAVARAHKAGLSAGAFRGRLFVDKETGERPMCDRADEVQLCVDAKLPVATSMCKSGDMECEFRQSCPYYRQLNMLRNCDVVMVPHASLFHKMPTFNTRGLLIIDEQFVFDGEQPRRALLISDLKKNDDKVFVKADDGEFAVDEEHTSKLHQYRDQVADCLRGCADGNLSNDAVRHLSPGDIGEAIRLEWQTVVRSPVLPGMSRKRIRAVLAGAAAIKRMRLRVDFWEALLALVNGDDNHMSGWLVRATDDDDRAVVNVGGRSTIKSGWFDGLAACLDATSAPDLVKLYFPHSEVVCPPAVEAVQPNVTTLQTIDKTFSASMCIPVEGLEAEEYQRRKNRAAEVWRFIWLRASEFRGQGVGGVDVLVICQQALEAHLRELGLPDNVDIAHFNATRGIDKWGGVRCVITVGRTLPAPHDVEVLTENLTGKATDKLPDGEWYPRQSAGIDIGGGVGLTIRGERHPDLTAEIVRWQICEAELTQCLGRGRGVNRTPDDPLHVDILTNVCLPLKVDEPIRWDDNAPGAIEEMVARGLLPDTPAAAALVYPDIWTTANSAKMASRNRRATRPNVSRNDVPGMFSKKQLNGVKPLLGYFNRGLTPFSTPTPTSTLLDLVDEQVKFWALRPLAYGALSRMEPAAARVKRPGKRALRITFLYDPVLIPNPQSWLTTQTGVEVEVTYPTPPHTEPIPSRKLAQKGVILDHEYGAASGPLDQQVRPLRGRSNGRSGASRGARHLGAKKVERRSTTIYDDPTSRNE